MSGHDRLSTPLGPYDTETQAYEDACASWYDRERAARAAASRSDDGSTRRQAYTALLAECAAAGVEADLYDQATLRWLSDWEIGTVQVILGLIRRASMKPAETKRSQNAWDTAGQ